MFRKIIQATLLLGFVVAATALANAQTPTSNEAALASFPNPQLHFDDWETYDVNGTKLMRFKLTVKNRASHPDFLWAPAPHLPACGMNDNASRTWVEVFGSPERRLSGFCNLRSSDDLDRLWFAMPPGEKGPPCVYIVMTDRQTGKKYKSNSVCSRLFTVVRGRLKAGGQTAELAKERHVEWIELTSTQVHQSPAADNRRPGDVVFNQSRGHIARPPDSGVATARIAKIAQPDLRIRQFLFPPTNDKALRVHVVNTGQAPSGVCRLILTVRKINGAAVGRKTHVNVPALAAGADVWLLIDAKSILPNNVSLQSTTFRLNVDATGIVAESDEGNNEVWHNL